MTLFRAQGMILEREAVFYIGEVILAIGEMMREKMRW